MSNSLHFNRRSIHSPMLFASLPQDVQDLLLAQAAEHRFADGQRIQYRGDNADGFWLIVEGSVSVGQFLPDGEFRGMALLGPGDSYGELALFAHRPRVVDAVSRGDSRLRLIRSTLFEQAIAGRPDAMRPMLGALAGQLQEMLEVIGGLRKGTSRARVAGMLATLARDQEPPVEIDITQEELAELLGLSRATANGALRELAKNGMIERRYGKIVVRDPDALRLLALA